MGVNKHMRKILKRTGVIFIVTTLFLSTVVVTADTIREQNQIGSTSPSSERISEAKYDFSQKIKIQPINPPARQGSNTLISEGFENGWFTDPDGDPYVVPNDPNFGKWDIDGRCIDSQAGAPGLTHYWSDFEPSDHTPNYPFPHSGDYCMGIWWSDGNGGEHVQDEWLMTPNMDTSKYENLILTFYSAYNMMRGFTNPTANNFVKYSTDGGLNWVTLGDLYNDPQFDFDGCTGGPLNNPSWNWNEVQIVLDLPDSDQLMIAWHYSWDAAGAASGWMVDDINIYGKKSINAYEKTDIYEGYEPLIINKVKQFSNPSVIRILEKFQTEFHLLQKLIQNLGL